jgi:cephalosporin hydroxylase
MFKKKKSFSLEGVDKGHHQVTYKGVPCIKCPFDYVIYQMIIEEVKPDLIIEIGTNKGGSTLYLADLLELQGKGKIHSIDITDECIPLVKDHPRITLFHQGWEEYDISLTSMYQKILVIEDASHQYQSTLGAIQKFSKVVSTNSYLIVEDGIIDDLGLKKKYNGGPVKAIEEFLVLNTDFKIDLNWVDFFGPSATFNTKGYLKRLK